MDFKNIELAAAHRAKILALEKWLKQSWHANTSDCRLIFADRDNVNFMVDIPLALIRAAVSDQIKELYAELGKMGVDLTKK